MAEWVWQGCHTLLQNPDQWAFLLHKRLHDSLSRATVPTLRNAAMLPLAVNHACEFLTKAHGILAHKHVGTNLHGLDMLGVAVERDAGHGVERCLLGHIARVGDDAEGVGW